MPASSVQTFHPAPELMGASAAAETARVYVARAADTREPVLISAERGLDAPAVCRAIHEGSDLTAYPLTEIECFDQSGESFDRDVSAGMPYRTIVLKNLDELTSPLQQRLAQILEQWCGKA